MRTVAVLAGLLLLTLPAVGCARGSDPWDTTGWQVETLDYETELWTPIDASEAGTMPAPPQVPARSAPAAGGAPPPATSPATRPGPTHPGVRSAPGVPPPPPPPYPLPR